MVIKGPGNFGAVKASGAIAGMGNGKVIKAPLPAKKPVAKAPAAKATVAPRAAQQQYSAPAPAAASQSLGTSSTGVMSAAMPEPEPPAPIQLGEDEWRAQDSTYLGEESGLNLSYEQAMADLRNQRSTYNQDYGQSLRNLGRSWEDANNDGIADDDEVRAGSWDKNNMQGAYGQAYNNQMNDFSGRNMLGSSFYQDAQSEMDRGFNSQFDQGLSARTNYLNQIAQGETSAADTKAQALALARASASQRRANEYGL